MDHSIRQADAKDADAIARIVRLADVRHGIAEEPFAVTVKDVVRQLDLCAADDSHLVLVAVDANDDAIGYITVHWLPYPVARGTEGYVSDLFVDTAARGQGIGQRLIDEVAAIARRRGCRRLMLMNGRESESYQRGFYASRGWTERPTIANFVYPLDKDDA